MWICEAQTWSCFNPRSWNILIKCELSQPFHNIDINQVSGDKFYTNSPSVWGNYARRNCSDLRCNKQRSHQSGTFWGYISTDRFKIDGFEWLLFQFKYLYLFLCMGSTANIFLLSEHIWSNPTCKTTPTQQKLSQPQQGWHQLRLLRRNYSRLSQSAEDQFQFVKNIFWEVRLILFQC